MADDLEALLSRGETGSDAPNMVTMPATPAPPYQLTNYGITPDNASAVRKAITDTMAVPGWEALPPEQQRDAVHDAVAKATGAPKVGPVETFMRKAGDMIPGGASTEAFVNSLVGPGSFRQNYDAGQERMRAGVDQHPVAAVAGGTAGLGALTAVTGGFGAGAGAAPVAPSVAGSIVQAARPVATAAVAGGAQAAGTAAVEGKDAGEIVNRGLTGAAVGGALGAGVPLVAAGAAKLFQGAMSRSDERILSEVSDGATRKQREKLDEKADELVDLIRREPTLKATYKTPSHFIAAADDQLTTNGVRLNKIYDAADKINGPIDAAALAGKLSDVQKRLGGRLATTETSEALAPTIAKLTARADGGPVSGAELREEISRLQRIAFDRSATAAPTATRDAAAVAAGRLKDALEEHVQHASETVKRMAAGLGGGHDMTPAVPSGARQLAAPESTALVPPGAVGNVEYIPPGGRVPAQLPAPQTPQLSADDMARMAKELDMGTVRQLNNDQTVLMRIKAAAEYKAASGPKGNTSRLSENLHRAANVVTGSAGLGAAVHGAVKGDLGEVAAGVAGAAGYPIARAGARAADEGLATVGRRQWATDPTDSAKRLATHLATVTSPDQAAQAIQAHVFGGSTPAAEVDTTTPAVPGWEGM